MLNSVHLLGRLAQDPELRSTTSGTLVARFDLAVNTPSKDREAPPDYIPIVCWQSTAEFAQRYLGKGRQIVVEGRISTSKYTDKDGKNRKSVEVVASRFHFAESKKNTGNSEAQPSEAPDDTFSFMPVDDDSLPF